MAAVLVAHIKDPDMDEIGVIVNYLCKGGSFTIDDLKYILGDTIKLKSASPDALQNLYNNLQKIQR
jgi:hypothetical protein